MNAEQTLTHRPDISDSGFWVETEWPSSKQTSPGKVCSGSLRSAGSDRSPGLWSSIHGWRSVWTKKTVRHEVMNHRHRQPQNYATKSCLNFRFSSGLVTDLRRLGVHVHISLVLHLSPENLRPGFETRLQSHSEDALDLRRKRDHVWANTTLRTDASSLLPSSWTHLDVQFIDPDGQVGVWVQVQVVHSLLDAVEDLSEHLVLVHAGFKRANLQINLLLDQKQIIHLRVKLHTNQHDNHFSFSILTVNTIYLQHQQNYGHTTELILDFNQELCFNQLPINTLVLNTTKWIK